MQHRKGEGKERYLGTDETVGAFQFRDDMK